MKVVDELRHGTEPYLFAVVVEDIERESRNYRVAHGRLLLKEMVSRDKIGVVTMPAAPLVDDKLRAVLKPVGNSRSPVAVDKLLHLSCPVNKLIPLFVRKVHRSARRAAVEVERETAHSDVLL